VNSMYEMAKTTKPSGIFLSSSSFFFFFFFFFITIMIIIIIIHDNYYSMTLVLIRMADEVRMDLGESAILAILSIRSI